MTGCIFLFAGRWAYNWGRGGGVIIRARGAAYKRTFTVWFVRAPVSQLFFRVETSRGRKEY